MVRAELFTIRDTAVGSRMSLHRAGLRVRCFLLHDKDLVDRVRGKWLQGEVGEGEARQGFMDTDQELRFAR